MTSTPSPDAARRVGHYERIGTVGIAEVLDLIRSPAGKTPVLGKWVGVSSLRLQTFAREDRPCCSNPECIIQATHFAVERSWRDDPGQRAKQAWHLNLYGRDQYGQEVLFTHDHTLARGLGGPDDASNTTTMCLRCNTRKSVHEHRLIKAMRQAQGIPSNGRANDAPQAETLRRELEKAQGHLAWLAGERGMDEANYREFCNLHGGAYARLKPIRYVNKRHRHVAHSLGLTQNGYRFLRHDHNERQRAIRAAQPGKSPGPGR